MVDDNNDTTQQKLTSALLSIDQLIDEARQSAQVQSNMDSTVVNDDDTNNLESSEQNTTALIDDSFESFKQNFIAFSWNAIQEQDCVNNIQLTFEMTADEIEEVVKRFYAVFNHTKTPLQILHEMEQPSKLMELSIEESPAQPPVHAATHSLRLNVTKIGSFRAIARSKQEAKQMAARMVLGFIQSLVDNFCKSAYYQTHVASKQASNLNKTNMNKKSRIVSSGSKNSLSGQLENNTTQPSPPSPFISVESISAQSLQQPPCPPQVCLYDSSFPLLPTPSHQSASHSKVSVQSHLSQSSVQRPPQVPIILLPTNENFGTKRSFNESTENDNECFNMLDNNNAKAYKAISDVEINGSYLLEQELAKKVYDAIMEKTRSVFSPENIARLVQASSVDISNKSLLTTDLWRYKEISGFVLINELDGSTQVLSLATGTKCLSSEHLSLYGDTVQDSHAEILARRALLCVLYEQIDAIMANNLQDKPEFLLEVRPNGHGFRLKSHLKLHLYISSSPCGDARVFNFTSLNTKERKSYSKGILRMKVEHGQGTIPTPINYISTWDGIITSNQRATFMSCSDKLCMWNVVGVQGSLLSYFLEPIYIQSLVVSRLFRVNHLIRSSYSRIIKHMFSNKLTELLSKKNAALSLFKVNEHKFGFYHSRMELDSNNDDVLPKEENKETQAINPSTAHNWFHSLLWQQYLVEPHLQIELIKANIGSNHLTGAKSRLCKRALMDRFVNLVCKYNDRIPSLLPYQVNKFDLDSIFPVDKSMIFSMSHNYPLMETLKGTYNFLKNGSYLYRRAKLALCFTLRQSGLGSWVIAPVDVDMFELDEWTTLCTIPKMINNCDQSCSLDLMSEQLEQAQITCTNSSSTTSDTANPDSLAEPLASSNISSPKSLCKKNETQIEAMESNVSC